MFSEIPFLSLELASWSSETGFYKWGFELTGKPKYTYDLSIPLFYCVFYSN